ncbi:MAG: hypothetical protein ACI9YB_002831, partial [Halioglobus sp.]
MLREGYIVWIEDRKSIRERGQSEERLSTGLGREEEGGEEEKRNAKAAKDAKAAKEDKRREEKKRRGEEER